MREVFVAGVSQTDFGVLPHMEIGMLGAKAVLGALKDAGLNQKDIPIAYCGNANGGFVDPQSNAVGQIVLREAGISRIPVMRVENACASGACAFREAYLAVASGICDIALAFGVEKITGTTREQTFDLLRKSSDTMLEGMMGVTFPGVFAMMAIRHMMNFGTTRIQLAKVSVKNHKNALLNPHAHFHKEISIDDVLQAPLIADPLGLYDCCPTSDGAAASILASKDVAKNLKRMAVKVRASILTSGAYENADLISFPATVKAAEEAYRQAGITAKDINFAEVHDCFTIAEIIHYEDLGFCRKGEGGKLIDHDDTAIGGMLPVNTSGGLKAKGHPVGATGISQVCEAVKQIRGEAGLRQVSKAEMGLTHCMGGFINGDGASCVVNILSAD